MSGRNSQTYIDFDVYGCWLNPATQEAMVCQFQKHRDVMRSYMDRVDPDSRQSVFKWAFAHGWIKIENERDLAGSQINLQGQYETLKRAWPLLRRELLHADNIFIDIEDMSRHIRWVKYQDRERIRNFDISNGDQGSVSTSYLGFAPCYQL